MLADLGIGEVALHLLLEQVESKLFGKRRGLSTDPVALKYELEQLVRVAEETVDLGKDLGLALQRQQLLSELDGSEDGLGHFLEVGGGN